MTDKLLLFTDNYITINEHKKQRWKEQKIRQEKLDVQQMKNLKIQYDLNYIKLNKGNLKNYQSIVDNIINSQIRLKNYEFGTEEYVELKTNINFMMTLKDKYRTKLNEVN